MQLRFYQVSWHRLHFSRNQLVSYLGSPPEPPGRVGSRRRSARSHHPNGQEFIRALNQHRSASGLQFVAAAETPKDPNGRNAMRGGGNDIVLPVPNHADVVGLQALGLQQVGDQLGLVLEAAVEFRAVEAR